MSEHISSIFDTTFQIILTIVSIVIVLVLESHRKPKLEISIGDIAEISPNDPLGRQRTRWVHVNVANRPMSRWLSWVWDREPAMGCRGWVRFCDMNRNPMFNGKKMDVRWSNNPEPTTQDPRTGQVTGIDWDKMRVGNICDIPSGSISDGDFGQIALVVKIVNDDNCYGWNNYSYVNNWKHPEWVIPQGIYLAKLVIKTGGQTFSETINIYNPGPFDDFRISTSDIKL